MRETVYQDHGLTFPITMALSGVTRAGEFRSRAKAVRLAKGPNVHE